jgi:uncharacterized protein DUF6491
MQYPLAARAIAGLGLAVLGACVSGVPPHQSEQQLRDRYAAYAGAPIDSFTWLGHFYSWEQLGKDQLVVFTTPSDAYLLKVWPSCDLRWVISPIAVSSTGGTVSAHLDSIRIDSPPTGRMVCPIDEIRRIDYQRMRAELRAPPPAAPQR